MRRLPCLLHCTCHDESFTSSWTLDWSHYWWTEVNICTDVGIIVTVKILTQSSCPRADVAASGGHWDKEIERWTRNKDLCEWRVRLIKIIDERLTLKQVHVYVQENCVQNQLEVHGSVSRSGESGTWLLSLESTVYQLIGVTWTNESSIRQVNLPSCWIMIVWLDINLFCALAKAEVECHRYVDLCACVSVRMMCHQFIASSAMSASSQEVNRVAEWTV